MDVGRCGCAMNREDQGKEGLLSLGNGTRKNDSHARQTVAHGATGLHRETSSGLPVVTGRRSNSRSDSRGQIGCPSPRPPFSTSPESAACRASMYAAYIRSLSLTTLVKHDTSHKLHQCLPVFDIRRSMLVAAALIILQRRRLLYTVIAPLSPERYVTDDS